LSNNGMNQTGKSYVPDVAPTFPAGYPKRYALKIVGTEMKDFVQFIQDEWAAISSAPVTFILLLISLKERIESFKDRLEAKDDQLTEYRERLHLLPTSETTYSRLSNAELKNKTLDVVHHVRDFLKNRKEKQDRILYSDQRANHRDMSEEQRKKLWHQETNALMRESTETNADYNRDFKVDTILLRDELLSRLPSSAKNEREYRTYEHPTNPIGMGMVADDLERLAKSLPSKGGA